MSSILWDQLEWTGPAPARDAGPVAFFVIAPWCPDCREAAPRFSKVSPKGVSTYLVGEFSSPEDVAAFAAEYALDWPILAGQGEKSELSRQRARFKQLRDASGDERRWGLPLLIVGRLENGWLVADRIQTEF
jgi:thiol-disulfide isomerase/thioredoxin